MISVSYLKSNLSKLETIKKIDESIADYIHVDLMDGQYVTTKNFEINEVINDLKDTTKPLDIHLMVKNPEQYISDLAKLKPSIITIHLKSTSNINEVIDLIKDYNIKVGIALNPDEDVNLLDEYIKNIDYVLIMSVYPGAGGQKFIKEVLSKIKYFSEKNILLGIDGGINEESIKYLDSNIYNIVSGSFICLSDDYNKQITILKKGLQEVNY